MADQLVPLKAGSPSTPQRRSPIKKRKGAISLQQKQALIDNLQLEITERARRLRAQYNIQAQGLKARIEIRINRIPPSLRKAQMGELLLKCLDQEEKRTTRQTVTAKEPATRASPHKLRQAPTHAAKPAGRAPKRMSDVISGNKENDMDLVENAKKRLRAAVAENNPPIRPAQVLSPTSSNSRLANRSRPASPTKSQIARPASPLKSSGTSRSAAATSVLSNLVEKAKATRAASNRKVTATSNASSSSTGTTAATRTRRAAAPAAPRAPTSRPATRNARRASGNSESSETSTATVVKRRAAPKAAPAAPAPKKGMMNSIRKGVAGATGKKAAAKAAAPAPAAGTGRVLRKRG
ncbi:hypothetical protein G7046_g1381 [Stylonectria norvegica]|nr:hypothetical protein G7046_g1381 [Stylonectria norvegica]